MRHFYQSIFAAVLSLGLSGLPSLAAAQGWNQLAPEEKKALRNYREDWASYPEQRRQQLLQGARRYQQLSPQERKRLQRARERYRQMDPDERQRLRQRYLHSRER